MIEQDWSHWSASVRGPLHLKTGLPNQDFCIAKKYKWGAILAVSDGLGSKKHSDHGSRCACLAVVDAAHALYASPHAKINDILRLIHASWLVRIAPFPADECYATCLFCMIIGDEIILGRLGDGMVAVLASNDNKSFILSDKKNDSFSNYTNSLDESFTPEHWEIVKIKAASYDAVLLCTDGISDDLLSNEELSFASGVCSAYAQLGQDEINSDLTKWLNDWPVPGHSDDKTIACIFKKGDIE